MILPKKINTLEVRFGKECLPNIALSMCIGGNDCLPKLHGLSHEKLLIEIVHTPGALHSIVRYTYDKDTGKPVIGVINEDVFSDIIKRLYCPSNISAEAMNLELVRQMSIKPPYNEFRHPARWMPPKSALLKVSKLINCHIAYMMTVSKPDAPLPKFLEYGCLKKDDKRKVQYDFGNDIKVDNLQRLLTIGEAELKINVKDAVKVRKKRQRSTPSHGMGKDVQSCPPSPM